MISFMYWALFAYGLFCTSAISFPTSSICSLQQQTILKYCENVFKGLGVGHTEKVYHNALLIELQHNKIPYRSEVMCPYFYRGKCAGYGSADVVVFDTILELKSSSVEPLIHAPQLKKYVFSLRMHEKTQYNGMLINFNQKSGKIDHLFYTFNNTKLT
jgi:GxxExxY protein